jgi:hypothetical protein
MSDIINQFPSYKRVLSSHERTIMAKIGWACATTSNLEESEKFDESFNHKACDEKGIPRIVDQPVNFSI